MWKEAVVVRYYSHGSGRAKGSNEIPLYSVETEIGHRLEHEIPQYEVDVL
jgi:hypothetical protein